MKIGDRLRELRSRRKLSVRAVALRSGISHSSISLIERDLISPSLDTLHAVLDALGTTLSGFSWIFRLYRRRIRSAARQI